MKLITFTREGISSIGAIINEEVVDLHLAYKKSVQARRKNSCTRNCKRIRTCRYDWIFTRWKRKHGACEKSIDFALTNKKLRDQTCSCSK